MDINSILAILNPKNEEYIEYKPIVEMIYGRLTDI